MSRTKYYLCHDLPASNSTCPGSLMSARKPCVPVSPCCRCVCTRSGCRVHRTTNSCKARVPCARVLSFYVLQQRNMQNSPLFERLDMCTIKENTVHTLFSNHKTRIHHCCGRDDFSRHTVLDTLALRYRPFSRCTFMPSNNAKASAAPPSLGRVDVDNVRS